MTRLDEIKERIQSWELEGRIREWAEQGKASLITSVGDTQYLIARLERFHREVSMIRRATDDIPEFKDINRMAREALTEGESVPMTNASLDELLKEWEATAQEYSRVVTTPHEFEAFGRILSLIAVVRKQRDALLKIQREALLKILDEASKPDEASNVFRPLDMLKIVNLVLKTSDEAERILKG